MQQMQRRPVSWSQVSWLALALAAGAWMMAQTQAAEQPQSRRSKASDSAPTSSRTDGKIESKLDEILANQEKILKRFDDVMEELRIVKVRATLN